MRRALRVGAFVGWYVRELLRSYARMIVDILGSGRRVTPAVVRVDTHCARETEIGVLGMLLTLSPGTVVLDARAHSPDAGTTTPWTLYVHGIHEADPERLRRTVHEMEYRLLAALGRTDLPPRYPAGGPDDAAEDAR